MFIGKNNNNLTALVKRSTALRLYGSTAGFTALEMLIAVAIIVLLLGIVVISLRDQGPKNRDAERRNEVKAIADALTQWSLDTGTYTPANIPIGAAAKQCIGTLAASWTPWTQDINTDFNGTNNVNTVVSEGSVMLSPASQIGPIATISHPSDPVMQNIVNVSEGRIGDLGGSATFEFDIGATTVAPSQTAQFVWPNGTAQPFTLTYDTSTNLVSFTVGGNTLTYTPVIPITVSSGLYLRVGASASTGTIFSNIILTDMVLNGTPLTVQPYAVNPGAGLEVVEVSGEILSNGFTLTGKSTMNWVGTPPSQSKLAYQMYIADGSKYTSSGTYISLPNSVGAGANFGTMNWVETAPSDSGVAIKVRSCDDDACSSAGTVDESTILSKQWASINVAINGNDISGGSVTDGDGWIQYQAVLNASADQTQTPSLDSITINYSSASGSCYDLSFLAPQYLNLIPEDPKSTNGQADTGYTIYRDTFVDVDLMTKTKEIIISAPNTENGDPIEARRK